MFKRIVIFLFLITLLLTTNTYAKDYKYIEIFNLDKEKVVKEIKSNKKIERLANRYLHDIDGIYSKFNPIPSAGYAVKIPLDSPVKIQNKWINAFVDQIIIMFPKDESPFLIIFDNEDRLLCFGFHGDTAALWKLLDFNINTPE